MLKIMAPAKLNLTLEVLGKRPDGYHEVRSVMQTIDLCDRLHFQPNANLSIISNLPEWLPEKSLVSTTVSLLQKVTRCSYGATITVEKRIPLVSGLGGDSSVAAAALRGLNKLWELGLSREKLLDLAAQLGSDVSFFLYGGTALAEGRGEAIIPLPPAPSVWFVLTIPSVPHLPEKTKQLYASLTRSHYTDGRITQRLVKALEKGEEFKPSLLFNTFENVAFALFPGLKTYREHILKLGADHAHLAGSGPALFTMIREKDKAEDLYTRCRQQKMETYLVETLGCGEQS